MCPNDAEGVASSVDPDQSSLIWVYTVCLDMSVRKLRIIMVLRERGLQHLKQMCFKLEKILLNLESRLSDILKSEYNFRKELVQGP